MWPLALPCPFSQGHCSISKQVYMMLCIYTILMLYINLLVCFFGNMRKKKKKELKLLKLVGYYHSWGSPNCRDRTWPHAQIWYASPSNKDILI